MSVVSMVAVAVAVAVETAAVAGGSPHDDSSPDSSGAELRVPEPCGPGRASWPGWAAGASSRLPRHGHTARQTGQKTSPGQESLSTPRHTQRSQQAQPHGSKRSPSPTVAQTGHASSCVVPSAASRAATTRMRTTHSTTCEATELSRPWPLRRVSRSVSASSSSGRPCRAPSGARSLTVAEAPAMSNPFKMRWRRRQAA